MSEKTDNDRDGRLLSVEEILAEVLGPGAVKAPSEHAESAVSEPVQEASVVQAEPQQALYLEPEVPIPAAGDDNGAEKKPEVKKKKRLWVIPKILLCLFTLIIVVVAGFIGGVALINYGPSHSVRDLLVTTVMQTSAAKPLATLFFSDDEIAKIMADNSIADNDAITDVDAIAPTDDARPGMDEITLTELSGLTYRATLMTINDPSRVSVATIPDYGAESGMTLAEMIELEGGIGGVNGGAFEDIGGMGTGNTPYGFVASHGVWRWGGTGTEYNLIGLDDQNRLIVGTMTGAQAREMNIRDAVTFGPALIVNGRPAEITGNGGGLNPRTAIGQRADGAILLLVIDGRQPNSLGGSYKDIIEIMLQYGAVNAANLDGGNSSHMIYEGEIITSPCALSGPRDMPTAIVVK